MDKYLKDFKNAVDSISAECDLTERAISKLRKNKREADNSSDTDIFIQTDIKTAGKTRKILPVAAAACLIAGIVSLPFILGSKISDEIPAGDEILTPEYTEVSVDSDTNSEITPDFELKEVKTFPEYKVLRGVSYAAGELNIDVETGNRNFAALAYSEQGSFFKNNTYVEFINSNDIPDEYIQKAGCNVSCRIKDFYVSEEGDIYYCGWLNPTDSDIMDGFIGKYNQNSDKTEFLKIFDEMVFELIIVTDNGEIRTACNDGFYYQFDDKAENIKQMEEEPDISQWPSGIMFDVSSPYLMTAFGHSFNDKYCILLDFMEDTCLRLCKMNLTNGETKILYSKRDFEVGRDGSIYTDDAFNGNTDSHLLAYKDYPVPQETLGTESIGDGCIRSCDINICTDFLDNDSGKCRHSLYSPDGVKLYDFDIPDEGVNWLGNISDESGEKIYYISGDKNKALCYEPETNQLSELTTLNDNFDFNNEKSPVFVCMTKSDKYDFLIWNKQFLYGYNINSDELTMITGTLDYYEMDYFTDFTADDDGNIYCTVHGSNTLYSIVKS